MIEEPRTKTPCGNILASTRFRKLNLENEPSLWPNTGKLMQTLIKCCSTCKGNGFRLVRREHLHSIQNITDAQVLYNDGTRVPTQEAILGPDVIGYEFACRECRGAGEFTWTWGRSLPPRIAVRR